MNKKPVKSAKRSAPPLDQVSVQVKKTGLISIGIEANSKYDENYHSAFEAAMEISSEIRRPSDGFRVAFLDVTLKAGTKEDIVPYTGTLSLLATVSASRDQKSAPERHDTDIRSARAAFSVLVQELKTVVSVVTNFGPHPKVIIDDVDLDTLLAHCILREGDSDDAVPLIKRPRRK